MEKSDDIDQFRITVSVSSQEKNSCFASLSFFSQLCQVFPGECCHHAMYCVDSSRSSCHLQSLVSVIKGFHCV